MALSEAQAIQLRFRRELAKARGPVRKPKPAAVLRFPDSARTRYTVALLAVLRDVQGIVREILAPRLPAIAEQARAALQRQDAPSDDATALMRQIRDRVESIAPVERAARISREVARETSRQNKRAHQTLLIQALGFDPMPIEEDLDTQLDAFVKQNVSLIGSLTGDTLTQIESVLLRGIREGQRVETISREITERFGIARRRADLIAVDQVASLNGELTRLRQTKLGVKRYTWSTSQDERVRPGHRALNQTVQRWDRPPLVDARSGRHAHPGGDIRCRCSAIPVLDEVFQALGIDGPPEPKRPKPTQASKPAQAPKPIPAAPAAAITPVQSLRVALTTHWGKRRKGGAAAVRTAARDFLGAEFGMYRVDRVAQGAISQKSRPGERGSWNPADGAVTLHQDVIEEIDHAVEALSKGELPSLEHAPGLRTLLHEETHGHGSAAPNTYRFAGRYVEEVVTEVIARQAVRRLMDIAERPTGPHPFALPRFHSGQWLVSDRRSYDTWIAKMAKDIQKVTNWEESQVLDALETASVAYKRDKKPKTTIEEVVRAWVDSVVGLNGQQQADLTKLVTARGYLL